MRRAAAVVALSCALALAPAARGAVRVAPLNGLRQAQRTLTGLVGQVRSPAERGAVISAAAALGRATIAPLWLDPRHTLAPPYGLSVFSQSRAALIALEHISGGPAAAPAALGAAARQILAADRSVAQGSIRQAAGGPGGLLARARGMVLSGDRWAVTSRFDLGAEQYGAGWRDAFQALSELVTVRTTLLPTAALSAAAEAALGNPRIAPTGVRPVAGRPGLVSAGKPEILFIGNESCRFCAVERWGLVVALSQFGTFSNLRLSQSASTASPVIRSFTFAGARYRSPYLSFAAVELSGEIPRPRGRGYEPLESLTGAQRSVFRDLDRRGALPFVDVANQGLDVGATVSPALVGGLSWSVLSTSLRHARRPAAQAIAATAEVLSAELCRATGGAPASVCGAAVVQDYAARLDRFGAAGGACIVTPGEVRRATGPGTR